MNAEQKQRAAQMMRRFSQANPRTLSADNAAVDMCALLHELIDAPDPEQPNQSEQHLEMVSPPAPSVPDSKTLQFLTDVLTAAGLLRHGKRDVGLATRIADESCRVRQQLFTQPEPPADLVRDAERWLSQRDLELLVMFGMQADDCDADGHTLSKAQTRRLCELGVLRNVGFGRSEMTSFGCVLFDQHWEQSRSLPLRTHAEYAAIAAEKGGAA